MGGFGWFWLVACFLTNGNIIKEIIGNEKPSKDNIPKRVILNSHETFDQEKIANCFNKFFVEIAPKLASIIPESQKQSDQYLSPHRTF